MLVACPNVLISYKCRNKVDPAKSLGNHLTSVKFNFVHGNSISKTLMSCCLSLSKIEVEHCPSLTALDFSCKQVALRSLLIMCNVPVDTLKNAPGIANSAGRLEKVKVLFQSSRMRASSIASFERIPVSII